MRRFRGWFFPGVLSALLAASANAETRWQPLTSGEASAKARLEIDPARQCRGGTHLSVEADSAEVFRAHPELIQSALDWAALSLDRDCPRVRGVVIVAYVGGQIVSRATAVRISGRGWQVPGGIRLATPATRTADAKPAPEQPLAEQPGQAVSAAQAPSASNGAPDPAIAQCDALAAHPSDPEAFAAGVPNERLDEKAVIAACAAAIKANPNAPRLQFQLARGYLRADRTEDATEQLIAAAEQSHGGALAYLADLQLDGVPGIDANPAVARSLYERAVASGFAPAEKVLKEFEDKTAEYEDAEKVDPPFGIDPAKLKPFANPQIIENIVTRRFDDVPNNEPWVKEYLYNVADTIRGVCEAHFTQAEITRLESAHTVDNLNIGGAAPMASLLGVLTTLARGVQNPEAFMADAAQNAADPFDESMKDVPPLFQRYMCKTPGLSQFSENLKAYVLNEDAPLPQSNAIMNACLRNPAPSKYTARDFCMCFTGNAKNARISQGMRKALTQDFKSAATEIMNLDVNRNVFRACRSGY